MPNSMVQKLIMRPVILLRLVWEKLIVGPLRYRRGRGYDAQRYWGDRFRKHGMSLKAAGVERQSEEDNLLEYEQAKPIFLRACREQGVSFPAATVAEIGVGSGFYTRLLEEQGVRSYLGIDITDVLFEQLRQRHPGFRFQRMDITSDRLEGRYDMIVMLDVVEHIVQREKLAFAMENVRRCLLPGGVFAISGLHETTGRRLFYVHSWSPADIVACFPGFEAIGPVCYRNNSLLLLRNSTPTPGNAALAAGQGQQRGQESAL